MRLKDLVFLSLAATLVQGCVSVSSVQMADTLGHGNFQVALEPGVQTWGPTSAAPSNSASTSTSPVFEHLDVSFRYGVSDAADVGIRIGMSLFEAQAKLLLTSPGNQHLALSLAPTLGGTWVPGRFGDALAVFGAALPFLIGVKTSGGSELVLGPRLQGWMVVPATSSFSNFPETPKAPFYVAGAGLSLGFAWRASAAFALMPEVSVLMPFFSNAGATGVGTSQQANQGYPTVQFKLGVLMGPMRQRG